MFTPVTATPAEAPLRGLVASAHKPPDDPNVRWESGFGWVPERCGTNYQLLPWCDASDPAAFDDNRPGAVYYRPPAARFNRECSVLGGGVDTGALRRAAEAATPFVIARELWEGDAGSGDTWNILGVSEQNMWLASPAAQTVTTAGTTFQALLAALEHEASAANQGQRIMLHLPILLSGDLVQYVDVVGNNLITRSGNLVVIDAGYTGTGPAGQAVGATAWAYATSMVAVRTSPLALITEPDQTVDRSTNTVTAWAERVFAAYFDPCVHFAVEITI